MSKQAYPIQFGGLSNTVDRYVVPPGLAFDGENFTVDRGILAGGPRRGTEWSRTGAHANDLAGGFTHAKYGSAEEFIVILKPNGSSTATAYTVNPTTGAYTAITGGSGLAWGAGEGDNVWTFAQYEDFVYCGSPAGGWWMRRIGGPSGSPGDANYRADDHWRAFSPEYVSGDGVVGATLERPPYQQREFVSGDTRAWVAGSGSYHYFTTTNLLGDATLQIGDTTFSENTLTYFSIIAASAIDLSGVDYVCFRLRATAFDPEDWIVLNSFRVAFLPDHTTALTANWAASQSYITADWERPTFDEYVFRVDIRSMTDAQKAGIRRVLIRLEDFTWRPFTAKLGMYLGGAEMWDVTGTPPDIEYAYAYYNSTTQVYTNATKEEFNGALLRGEGVLGGSNRFGAWVELGAPADGTLSGAGYDKIRFFRRATSTELGGNGRGNLPDTPEPILGGWKLIGTVNNSGTPEFIDKSRESVIRALPSTELSFEPYSSGLDPEFIATWKQHLVLAQDRKLFFSYSGQPRRFIPGPESDFTVPDSNPVTMARTLYLSAGKTEPVRSMVGRGDMFFSASSSQAFYMVGDTANTATPPRQFPGNRGAVGPRSAARFDRGFLVASRDALWLLSVGRATANASEDVTSAEELTQGIRPTWKSFIGSSSYGTVVEVHEDEVWLFNGEKYLRLSRSLADGSRNWEYGEQSASINHTSSTPERGLRVLTSTGRICTLVSGTSDYNYVDPAGAINYFWESGMQTMNRGQIKAIRCIAQGSPVITIKVDTGLSGEKTVTFPAVSGIMQKDIAVPPHFAYAVKVEGVVGTDSVRDLVLFIEGRSDGYGD